MTLRQITVHRPEPPFRISTAKGKGRCLVAAKKIAAGDEIFQFAGTLLSSGAASDNALQIDEDVFLESSRKTLYENYLNHSCDPNCVIRMSPTQVRLVARRDIGGARSYASTIVRPKKTWKCRHAHLTVGATRKVV